MWSKLFQPAAELPALPEEPDLLLIFGPTDALRSSGVLARLHERFPSTPQLACSTGSSVAGVSLDETGVQAVAVGFSRAQVRLHTQPLPDASQSRLTGQKLAGQIATDNLVGVILFSVGLDVNGSHLVEGVQDILGREVAISGGLAGDGERFGDTLIAINGEIAEGAVAALALYGESLRISLGCYGGWTEFGPRRLITASDGATLYELDGKPALDLYETYLGPEAESLPASGLIYPLKVWDPANPEEQFVRTLLGIERERRALILAGDVPQGWRAQLMRGSIDHLVNGAERAAQQAHEEMLAQGVAPQLCLFVSCVGRRMLLGQRTEEELEAVASVIGGDVPISGFYSYGEIAPQNAAVPAGLHNQTVTLTLLAEAA